MFLFPLCFNKDAVMQFVEVSLYTCNQVLVTTSVCVHTVCSCLRSNILSHYVPSFFLSSCLHVQTLFFFSIKPVRLLSIFPPPPRPHSPSLLPFLRQRTLGICESSWQSSAGRWIAEKTGCYGASRTHTEKDRSPHHLVSHTLLQLH